MNRPKVRKEGSTYIFQPTDEAKKFKSEQRRNAITHEEVHAAALNRAHDAGIQRPDANTTRGFYEMQIGKYQGQSFRWLVENDMGYVTHLLTQIEREGGNTGPGNMNDNKRQLKWYVESFPYGRAALAQRRKENERKETINKQNSSLVAGNLPPTEVARRLQMAKQGSRVTPSSRVTPNIQLNKPKQNIAVETVSACPALCEFSDDALLHEVEALEASQPSCQAEKHSSQQSEGNVSQSKSIEPSSSMSPHGQLEPSSPPKTLSQLRAKPTLGERLSQPGRHFNGPNNVCQYTCHKCMKSRDNETHTQVQGKWFCKETATESLEEFLAREKPKEKKCRKRKHPENILEHE